MTAYRASEVDAGAALHWAQKLVTPAMNAALDTLPGDIRLVAGYHVGWLDRAGGLAAADQGGKAIRPALALLSSGATGGTAEAAIPAAVAVELVHNFSLLHDDVMDRDQLRRHRPTAWTVFGNAQTILAGDALLALATRTLAGSGPAVDHLGRAVVELCHGQSQDMAFESRADVSLEECLAMAGRKIGSLLGAACGLGGLLGGGTPQDIARLTGFGLHLGLAFQLVDDLLGIWGDPAFTGKPVRSDLHSRKRSLPVVAALTSPCAAAAKLAELYRRDEPMAEGDARRAADLVEESGGRAWAQDRARQERDLALRDLERIEPVGRDLGSLRALAEHLIDRHY